MSILNYTFSITILKRIKSSLLLKKNPISQRKLAIKFGCDRTRISKTINKKTFIKIRSKTNNPKRTEAQIRQVKACLPNVQYLPEY